MKGTSRSHTSIKGNKNKNVKNLGDERSRKISLKFELWGSPTDVVPLFHGKTIQIKRKKDQNEGDQELSSLPCIGF